jgi:predicted ATP-grasp superfamily ATP-dependent carboligase
MVMFIDKNEAELKSRGFKFACSRYRMKDLINKDIMKGFAKTCGFQIPAIYDIDNIEDNCFPILAKPRNSIGYLKKDFRIMQNRDELNGFKNENIIGNYILEEYIPGTDTDMVGAAAYRNSKGETFVPYITGRLRQYPADIGAGSYIVTFHDEKIKKFTEKLLEAMEYVGMADLDFKRNPKDGNYCFLEINYRAGAAIYGSTSAAANLPYAFYMDMLDCRIDIPDCRNGVAWMQDETDWKHLFKRVKLLSYIKDIKSADSFAIYNRNDIKPALHMWVGKLINKISKM